MSCGQCTRRCLKTHSNNSDAPASYSFFKILVASSFTEFLVFFGNRSGKGFELAWPKYLPPNFGASVLENKGRLTYLDDVLGGRWQVRISLLNGSLAFQEGWSKFVSDHALSLGELLVFTHFPRSNYVVRIYGTNSLERLTFSEARKENFHPERTTASEPCKAFFSSEREIRVPNGNISQKRAHFAKVDSESPPSKKARIPERIPASNDFEFTRAEKSYPESENKNNGSFGECSVRFDRLSKDYLLKKRGAFQQPTINKDSGANNRAGHDSFGYEFGNGKMASKPERHLYGHGNDMKRKAKFEPAYSPEDMARHPPAGFAVPSPYPGRSKRPYAGEVKQSKSYKYNNEKSTTPSKLAGNKLHTNATKRPPSVSSETLSGGFECPGDESEESFETTVNKHFFVKKRGRHVTETWNASQFVSTRGKTAKTRGRKPASKNKSFHRNLSTHNVPEDISDESDGLSTEYDTDTWQSSSSHSSDVEISESEPHDNDDSDDHNDEDDEKVTTSDGPSGVFPEVKVEDDEKIHGTASVKLEVDEDTPQCVDSGTVSTRQLDKGKEKVICDEDMSEKTCGIEQTRKYKTIGESSTTCIPTAVCIIEERNGSVSKDKHTPGRSSPIGNAASVIDPNSLYEGLSFKEAGENGGTIEAAKTGRSRPMCDVNTSQLKCHPRANCKIKENFCISKNNGSNGGPDKQCTMSETCNGALKGVVDHTDEKMFKLTAINPIFSDTDDSRACDTEDMIQSEVIVPLLSDEEHYYENSEDMLEEDSYEDLEENLMDVTIEIADSLMLDETVLVATNEEKATDTKMGDDEVVPDDDCVQPTSESLKKKALGHHYCATSDNLRPCQLERNADGSSSNLEASTSTNSWWSVIVTENSWLELPRIFPKLLQTKWQVSAGRIVIFLRDPAKRLWPILYHQIERRKAFNSGWNDFARANNIRNGDTCIFKAVEEALDVFQVGISSKA